MSRADAWHAAWRALPPGSLDAIIGPGTCIVLAPHPGDESLACGGLIAACCAADRAPLVAILTDGAGSHPQSRSCPPERLKMVRAREAHQAVGHLGLPPQRLVFCGYADTRAPKEGPGFEAAIRMLCCLCRHEPRCTAIVAPWRHDPHADHEAAALIAAAVAAQCGNRHIAYPIWGWLMASDTPIPEEPCSGWRLDVSAFIPAKRRAIRAHKSQIGELITDDPTAFRIPPALLSVFETPFETFLLA